MSPQPRLASGTVVLAVVTSRFSGFAVLDTGPSLRIRRGRFLRILPES